MEYSGSGNVTASVTPVDVVVPADAEPNASSSGCESADFAGFPAGNIALMQRGTCSFYEKAANAKDAGAAAAIIFNEGQDGRRDLLNGTLGEVVDIPAVGTTADLGEALYALTQQGDLVVTVVTDTHTEVKTTWNVIAESKTGRADNVVMLGAHLDSVLDGPGIQDNGSGSAAILEVALQMAKTKTNNKMRFAWWGAEEAGLLGSYHYVENLTEAEASNIALYLNFDMIASPNYALFVYDGDGSAFGDEGPDGSAQIEKLFTDYYAKRGLPSYPTAFDGRSDYGGFIDVGIPAGGLFTGAEGIKTAEQAEQYGGVAGDWFDPCYHQACDNIKNINMTALEINVKAIAHAAITYAFDTSSINGKRSPGKSHGAGKSAQAFDNAA